MSRMDDHKAAKSFDVMASYSSRSRRRLSWTVPLVALAVLVIVPVAVVWRINVAGRARFEAAMAEARAGGVPLTLAEIEAARRVWPDDENGAHIILGLQSRLEDLFVYRATATPDDDGEVWIELPPWFFAGEESIRIDFEEGTGRTFEPEEVADGRRLHLTNLAPGRETAWSVEIDPGHLPVFGDAELPDLGHRLDKDTQAALESLLQSVASELAEINRLAGFPGGRFPIRPDVELWKLHRPWLLTMRSAQRLKSVQVVCEAMAGETDAIVSHIRGMARLGSLLEEEPSLVSAISRVRQEELMLATLEWACAHVAFTVDQLNVLEAALASLDTDDKLYWAMLGERAAALDTVDAALEAEANWSWFERSWRYTRVPGLTGLADSDRADILHLYNRVIAVARDARAGLRISKEIDAALAAVPENRLLVWLLAPPGERARRLERRIASRLRAGRIALAAERYRLARGQWPQMLEELVPAFIDSLPTDPLDGRPFQYCMSDDSVFVHGRGLDTTTGGPVDLDSAASPERLPEWGFRLLSPEVRGRPPLTTEPSCSVPDN